MMIDFSIFLSLMIADRLLRILLKRALKIHAKNLQLCVLYETY